MLILHDKLFPIAALIYTEQIREFFFFFGMLKYRKSSGDTIFVGILLPLTSRIKAFD